MPERQPEVQGSSSELTPPKIVAASDNVAGALAAFVAQELEHWGFGVQSLATDGLVKVLADDQEFLIAITERS